MRPLGGRVTLARLALAAMLWPAASAVAQPAAEPASPAANLTPQQAFDQASQAQERGDCATALALFEHLAGDARVRPGTLAAGSIAVRRGFCLYDAGRYEESAALLRAGLPIVRKAGAPLAFDVFKAEQALGAIALRRWDHDGAVTHYKAALALVDTMPERTGTLIRLAQITAFDGGEEPLGYIREALRLEMAKPKRDKEALAAIHTVYGRILLNQGQNKAALAELKHALTLSGGLTLRVTLQQAALRGDLAQAALLNNDKNDARLYLAYTGAGNNAFATAASMRPPDCGPETGLSPDDAAIVEFSVDDDGDVSNAQTVYTRGDYAVAAAFARAVYGWYWNPDQIAKVSAFYKRLMRVELRCTTNGGRGPGILSPITDRVLDWAKPLIGETAPDKIGDGLETLSAMAARAESAGDLTTAAAALAVRGIIDPRWPADVTLLEGFDRALALADKAGVPVDVRNAIVVLRLAASTKLARRARAKAVASGLLPKGDAGAALAADAAVAGDAVAQDTLLLFSDAAQSRDAGAVTLLSRVADDRRLAEHHPLRQVALLQLANLAAADGKIDEAQGYFARTGLTEEQCALIGVSPAMKSSGKSYLGYPSEALWYRFEGWVNLEYDIDAQGQTKGIRPVIAYPPFVFVDAARRVAQGLTFESSYRPAGGAACSGKLQTVRFIVPSG